MAEQKSNTQDEARKAEEEAMAKADAESKGSEEASEKAAAEKDGGESKAASKAAPKSRTKALDLEKDYAIVAGSGVRARYLQAGQYYDGQMKPCKGPE